MPTSCPMDAWDLPSASGTLGLRPQPGRPSLALLTHEQLRRTTPRG
jgi:hypothetical protein